MLRALNSNKVQMPSQYNSYWFDIGHEIRQSDGWIHNSVDLGSINYENKRWGKEWSRNPILGDKGYIPIRIDANPSVIGWVKYSFSKEEGTVSILEKQFTTEDELIIE
jgi:hypothetical protein